MSEKDPKNEFDFNQPLLDYQKKPMTARLPSPDQQRVMRDLAGLVEAGPADSTAAARKAWGEAQQKLHKLEDEVPEITIRIGRVVVQALAGPADRDDKDGVQIRARDKVCERIAGDVDDETDEGQYGVVFLGSTKKTMIEECLLAHFKSGVVYSRIYNLLERGDQLNWGPEEEETDK